jgi:hypothetical protein
MTADVYLALAVGVLALHLLFNAWVVFGAAITRDRPVFGRVHIASLIYGAIIETAPWPCPLTLAEKWCEVHAGRVPYEGPFLLHYLDTLVYPNFPPGLLNWGAVGVCLANLALYARRRTQRHHHAI